MATVDGVVTAPDAHGVVQGNGGASDKMAGGSGSDKLEGHAAFNQYFGGAGDDTFIISDKFANESGAHDGQSLAFADQYAYIADFHGAGQSNGTGENDFIAFSGDWNPASLTLEHTGTSGTGGAVLYWYSVQDNTGHTFNFMVNSLNGDALSAGDFQFYS